GIEFERGIPVDRSEAGLGTPNVLDENLEIVQAPQAVLQPLEDADLRDRARAPEVALDLQRVAKLLGRNANGVQALREVQASGMCDRGFERRGTVPGLRGDVP